MARGTASPLSDVLLMGFTHKWRLADILGIHSLEMVMRMPWSGQGGHAADNMEFLGGLSPGKMKLIIFPSFVAME
jgi:hypothetical protein